MSKKQLSLYNQTSLSISIDTINLSVAQNISTEKSITPLRQSLLHHQATISLNNHEYIIYNKQGASIAKINNYYYGSQKEVKEVSIISIYGISQVYYEQSFSDVYHTIIKWATQYNPQITSIDYSYDHYYDYFLSISNYNNKSDVLSQNHYSINHLTKFPTHSIYVPLEDNDNLINEIKKKIINKQTLSDQVSPTANYYQYNYINDNYHLEFKKTIDNTKNNATHLKLSIKDFKSYYAYLNLIKEYTLNIEYSMTSDKQSVVILSNKLLVDVISYNKYSRDQENGFKEPYIIVDYKRQVKQYKEVSYQQLRQVRTEIRRDYKKQNLIITPQTISEVMKYLIKDVRELSSKTKVSIFPSFNKLEEYKQALRGWQKAKAKNKYLRSININDYGKTLSISTKQIDTMMNNLQECFGIKEVQTVSIFQDLISVPTVEKVSTVQEEPRPPKAKVTLATLGLSRKRQLPPTEPSDVLF